jgi:SET domain-containing protein
MFLIPTYLAASSIHGLGVFTPHFIPAGTHLWEFHHGVDWRLKPEEMGAFPQSCLEQIRSWAYEDEDGTYVFCGDNAKFMNHADEPNCDDSGPHHTVALRDIHAGEELTCNYRLFDEESKRLAQRLYPAEPPSSAAA